MVKFEEYADRFQYVRLERTDGILQMTFHSDGDTLQWGAGPHSELPEVFHAVGADPETKVVIMTGAGDGFTGPAGSSATVPRRTPAQWDGTYWEGKHLLGNLLDIEVPVIAAVNGPALRHSELPLLSDIVLAAPHTTFQDSGHFMSGLTPGDGMHIIYPLLLGMGPPKRQIFVDSFPFVEDPVRKGRPRKSTTRRATTGKTKATRKASNWKKATPKAVPQPRKRTARVEPTPEQAEAIEEQRREYERQRNLTPERREQKRRHAQEKRQRAKEQALCRDCGEPAIPDQTRCETCAEKHRVGRRK